VGSTSNLLEHRKCAENDGYKDVEDGIKANLSHQVE
jgi:hypothetical protein